MFTLCLAGNFFFFAMAMDTTHWACWLFWVISLCITALIESKLHDDIHHRIADMCDKFQYLKEKKADRPSNEIVCPKCGKVHTLANGKDIVDCSCGSVFTHNTWYRATEDKFYI